MGARMVKHFERLGNDGKPLREDQATLYRALAARVNYLSLDRADIAFAAWYMTFFLFFYHLSVLPWVFFINSGFSDGDTHGRTHGSVLIAFNNITPDKPGEAERAPCLVL